MRVFMGVLEGSSIVGFASLLLGEGFCVDGGGEDERWEVRPEGRVSRDGACVGDTVDTVSLVGGIEVGGLRDELDFSRSSFLTEAEDKMMGIEVNAVAGGGEGVGCEVGDDGGDTGEEDVAAIRAESSVIIVDTNAFTSCGEWSGGLGCIIVFSSASEGGRGF